MEEHSGSSACLHFNGGATTQLSSCPETAKPSHAFDASNPPLLRYLRARETCPVGNKMPEEKKEAIHTILVVSKDPFLADVRKHILEEAGFRVINALDYTTLQEACEQGNIDLVMIGYSLPPSEKRRAWKAAREICKTPILELYDDKSSPSLMEVQVLFSHRSHAPGDFLEAVKQALGNK